MSRDLAKSCLCGHVNAIHVDGRCLGNGGKCACGDAAAFAKVFEQFADGPFGDVFKAAAKKRP